MDVPDNVLEASMPVFHVDWILVPGAKLHA